MHDWELWTVLVAVIYIYSGFGLWRLWRDDPQDSVWAIVAWGLRWPWEAWKRRH